jgi:tetratricopeptide (TPR) repeat protein
MHRIREVIHIVSSSALRSSVLPAAVLGALVLLHLRPVVGTMLSNGGWLRLMHCVSARHPATTYFSACEEQDSAVGITNLFEWASRLDPSSQSAAMGTSWVMISQENYGQALQWLDRVSQAYRRDFAFVLQGETHSFAGDEQQAQESWQTGESDRFYYTRAEQLRASERFDSALDLYHLVLEIDPESHQAYSSMGQVYLELGDFPLARQAFEAKLELAPDGDGYSWLGDTLVKLGDRTAAIEAYANASELGRQDCYTKIGEIYRTQGEYALSRDWYLQAHQAFPQDIRVMVKLGYLSMQVEQAEQAHEYFQRAVDQEPDSAVATYYMAYWHYARQDYETALIWLNRALAAGLEPDYWVYKTMGGTYAHVGECALALESYQAALTSQNMPESERPIILQQMEATDGMCLEHRVPQDRVAPR